MRLSIWLVGTLAVCSCGFGVTQPPPASKGHRPVPKATSTLGSGPMARVPSGTFGPHLVLTDSGPFVAWAEPAEQGVSWQTMVAGSKTRLRLGPTLPKTEAPLAFFTLGPAKGGAVLARVTKKGGQDVVSATLLSPNGAFPSQELSADEGEILWVASVPDTQGARVLWARLRGPDAEISMTVLGGGGVATPTEVLRRGAIGWQLAQGRAGTWLVSLEGASAQAAVVLTRLDVASKARKSTEVAQGPRGAGQVDLWVGDKGLVVAFLAGNPEAPRLHMTEVDAAGVVSVAPRPVMPPRGEQTLLELVPGTGSTRPWLAWEEPALDGSAWRRVLLARLGPDGVSSPDAWLDVHGARLHFPELKSAGSQLIALTREPACTGEECTGGPSGLSISMLDVDATGRTRTAPVAALPSGLDRDALCWDLDCLGESCAVLCAKSDTPTSVHYVPLDVAGTLDKEGVVAGARVRTKGPLQGLSGAPRMMRRDVVAEVVALSDVAIGRGDAGTLLSWVTDFDASLRPAKLDRPAPDGRLEPYQADVRTVYLAGPKEAATPAAAAATAPPRVAADTIVSHRARSLGGVSLSAERASRRVLGWAALDQGSAHVFATLLDAQGKKLKQRLLGRKSGEVTDVQAVATSTGFVLLWVDDRSGRGQIYAQVVNPELAPVGPERALTGEASAPIGLSVLPHGEQLLLTFADGNGEKADGIFVMSVDASSLATIVPPRAVPHVEGHAHSPLLFADAKGGLGLAFIETRGTAEGDARAELRMVAVDAALRSFRTPKTILPGIDVSGFALACDARGYRVVVVSAAASRAEVWAAASEDGALFGAQFVLAFAGDAQMLPAPVLIGDEVFVAGPSGTDAFAVERLVVDFGLGSSPR